MSNGEGIGVALFVQGCHFHCKNCFNPETWEFTFGKEWTQEVKENFLKLIDKPYIKRISLLGGECLAKENLDDVLDLVTEINKQYNIPKYILDLRTNNDNIFIRNLDEFRLSTPNKSIWLYSGYKWEHIFDSRCHYHPKTQEKLSIGRWRRQQIVSQCNVFIDGEYIDSQQDVSLKWKGSKNQNVIDIQKSLLQNEIVLYCD